MNTRVAAVALACASISCRGVVERPPNIAAYRSDARWDVPELKPAPRMSEPDRGDTQALIHETLATIRKDSFATALARTREFLGPLWLGAYGDSLDQSMVLAAYLNQDANHPRLPATVQWKSGGSPQTGISRDGTDATITLNALTKTRWKSAEHKGCAIDTLAHELAHTVALHYKVNNLTLFTDEGRTHATKMNLPLASYVIGAVAECVYNGVDVNSPALRDCIHKLGADVSKPTPCDP